MTHTCPPEQLQAFSATAALVVAKAGAGFAGLVAGLTDSHLWVTVEARATVPHAAAPYVRTQDRKPEVEAWLAESGALHRAKF